MSKSTKTAKCHTCQRDMRPRGASAAEYPNTVARTTAVMCNVCYRRHGAPRTQLADDTPCVYVRTNLRPSTFRALDEFAKANGTTVSIVLSKLADRAVSKKVPPSRQALTEAEIAQIVELNAEGLSDVAIARKLGRAQTSVSRIRRHLGLPVVGKAGRRATS